METGSAWTLGLKRLAYSRIDLSLCCSVSVHLKGTWETQNHQTFCVSLVLVSFTLIYRAACPFLVKHSTIITSEESLRDSKLPVTECLSRDQGTVLSVISHGGGGGGGEL